MTDDRTRPPEHAAPLPLGSVVPPLTQTKLPKHAPSESTQAQALPPKADLSAFSTVPLLIPRNDLQEKPERDAAPLPSQAAAAATPQVERDDSAAILRASQDPPSASVAVPGGAGGEKAQHAACQDSEAARASATQADSAQDAEGEGMRSEYGAAPRAASASSRIKLLVAAQAALVSLLLAFMVLTSMGDSLSDASIEDVSQQVVESAGEDGKTMQEEDGRALKRNFGLSANDYEGVSYYGPVSNMDATEILVVKLEDTSQQQAVRDAIDTRISQQLSTFEGYAPVQAGQLQDAVVDVEGNYVLYAVGPNAQSVRSAFLKSL